MANGYPNHSCPVFAGTWHQSAKSHVANCQVCGATGTGFALKNLSARGTVVNGCRVETQEVLLQNGDVISIGQAECEYGSAPALQFKAWLEHQEPEQRPSMLCLWWLLPGSDGVEPTVMNKQLLAGPAGTVRVGRSMQPPEFWQSLVPDESLRNAISREHFEICPAENGIVLVNRSTAGTLLNGKFVLEQYRVQNGDVVAIPRHLQPEAPPIVQFRVEWSLDSATGLPTSCEKAESAVQRPSPEANPLLAASPPDVVHVSGALPPPFSIQCVAAGGESTQLNDLPEDIRTLPASFANAQMLVGTGFQPPEFWAAVLPEELRSRLAPLHFQLSMTQKEDGPSLILHGLAATDLNGVTVKDKVEVRHDDLVSITFVAESGDSMLLVTFRSFAAICTGFATGGQFAEPFLWMGGGQVRYV